MKKSLCNMFFNYIIMHFNKLCIICDIGTENLYQFNIISNCKMTSNWNYTHMEEHPIEPNFFKAKYLFILCEAIYSHAWQWKPDISVLGRPLGPGPLGPVSGLLGPCERTTRTVWLHHLDLCFLQLGLWCILCSRTLLSATNHFSVCRQSVWYLYKFCGRTCCNRYSEPIPDEAESR